MVAPLLLERRVGYEVMSAMAEVDSFLKEADEMYQGAVLLDGFDLALVAMGAQFNRPVAIYDYDKCVAILVERDGMTEEEAIEYFDFNVMGAWVGENTPIVVTRWAPWIRV
jgi:hypothetical protein